MVVESITEAEAQLSALIQKVQEGDTVIIKKAGRQSPTPPTSVL